jgi:cysteine-S-conjugate beta-lyase
VALYDFDGLTEADLRTRKSYKWTEYPPNILPAWVAEMDVPICRQVQAALHQSVDRHDLGYVPKPDKVGFAESVSAWCGRSFDWNPNPAHIFMVPDVVIGMDLAVQELTSPGDGVIVTTPIYAPFLIFSRMEGRVQVPIGLLRDEAVSGGRWRLDVQQIDEAFASGRAKVLALCHPHNPTGTVFSVEELDAVLASAQRHGCFVLSDEIHAPFVYTDAVPDGRFVPLATRPGADGVVVTVTSTSKTWNLAGLKCATMVVSGAELAARIERPASIKRPGVGILGLVAMMAAMEHGEPWRAEVLAHLSGRRDQLTTAMVNFDGLLSMNSPEATYLGWIDGSGLMNRLRESGLAGAVGVTGGFTGSVSSPKPGGLDGPAGWLLAEAGVAFSAGSSFGAGWADWFRWNFGTTTTLLDQMIERVTRAVRE